MPLSNRKLVTLGVLLGLFLSALEISVVGPAARTIAKDIGSLDSYSWIFTSYLVTTTLSMPLWGRLSDHWGRKRPFMASLALFLLGTALCGFSRSMSELVLFRAIKGLGGGGIFPLAFTLIADLYPMNERSKVQGYLSSVWGVASLIGPFVGGGLTEALGWRAIFFVTLVPGVVALFLIQKYLRERSLKKREFQLSFASLLTAALFVLTLLAALTAWQKDEPVLGGILLASSLMALLIFCRVERRVAYPLIAPALLKNRVFVMTCLTGFFSSMMVIGLSTFGPLYFQSVLGHSPTASGELLVPFTFAWVWGSIVSTRMLGRHSYRTLLLIGSGLTFLGFLGFMLLFYHLSVPLIVLTTFVMGWGMAFNYPIAVIVTQYSVPEDQVGFATSGVSWVRNIGMTIGTTVMGVVLSLVFQSKVAGFFPAAESDVLRALRDHPEILSASAAGGLLPAGLDLKSVLEQSLFWVFAVKFAAVTISFGLTFLFPKTGGSRQGGSRTAPTTADPKPLERLSSQR